MWRQLHGQCERGRGCSEELLGARPGRSSTRNCPSYIKLHTEVTVLCRSLVSVLFTGKLLANGTTDGNVTAFLTQQLPADGHGELPSACFYRACQIPPSECSVCTWNKGALPSNQTPVLSHQMPMTHERGSKVITPIDWDPSTTRTARRTLFGVCSLGTTGHQGGSNGQC